MSFITGSMLIFSVLGAIDRIIGNRFGIGKQFERGFMLFGNMALSMIGMIVISPVLADALSPFFTLVAEHTPIDPSVIPASLFANDMGGATLSVAVAGNEKIGMYNALVVSSMMGCTVSFTIPYALGIVEQNKHRPLLLGILCGIVTIPIGCFVGGLVSGISVADLILNILPLIVFSAILVFCLLFAPNTSVKVFGVFGEIIKIIITIGLSLSIIEFLSGQKLIEGLATLEDGAMICLNAAAVMTGAFPLIFVISKLLTKPLKILGKVMGVNETSAMGLISSLATSMTTFGMMKDMDDKGAMINSAFAVSAAFTFAGHLAFTMAFDSDYIFAVISGKLVAGFTALILAVFIYKSNRVTP